MLVSVCGCIDHVVSLGTCSYQNYEHNYLMSMNYFEPNFYFTVGLIMHSGDESAGICCSSQWWVWACWGRNVDSVKFVLPCRRRDRIHPYFLSGFSDFTLWNPILFQQIMERILESCSCKPDIFIWYFQLVVKWFSWHRLCWWQVQVDGLMFSASIINVRVLY